MFCFEHADTSRLAICTVQIVKLRPLPTTSQLAPTCCMANRNAGTARIPKSETKDLQRCSDAMGEPEAWQLGCVFKRTHHGPAFNLRRQSAQLQTCFVSQPVVLGLSTSTMRVPTQPLTRICNVNRPTNDHGMEKNQHCWLRRNIQQISHHRDIGEHIQAQARAFSTRQLVVHLLMAHALSS